MQIRSQPDKDRLIENANLFAVLVGILAGIVSYIISPDTQRALLVGIATGILAERISAHITNLRRQQDIEGKFDSVQQAIERMCECEYIGTADRAFMRVVVDLEGANQVKNTFLISNYERTSHPEGENIIAESYNRFFQAKDSNRWLDLLSDTAFHSSRYRDIEPMHSGQFVTKHIKNHNLPIVNFIVISYPDKGFNRLYFGWIYDEKIPHPPIFFSRDPRLVSYFDSYFNTIWGLGEDVVSLSTDER